MANASEQAGVLKAFYYPRVGMKVYSYAHGRACPS